MYTVYIWFIYIYKHTMVLASNSEARLLCFPAPVTPGTPPPQIRLWSNVEARSFWHLAEWTASIRRTVWQICWWHRRHRLLKIFDAIGQLYWWTGLCRDWQVWCLHLFPLAMWSDLNRVFCCAAAQAEVLRQLGVERRAPRGTLVLSVGCISKCVCCKYVACNYSSITCAIIYYT
jgi:hypothetical protein